MSQATESPVAAPLVKNAPPPDEEALYEFVNEQWVEKPAIGADSGLIASVLVGYLAPFLREHRLGRVMAEVLFLLHPEGDPKRRPDVAFVSYERWPRTRRVPSDHAWEVVPDLAIEVIRPSNKADEVVAKVREYFQAGVRRVWVVYPAERLVYVYASTTQTRILRPDGALEDEEILPGFRLPLTDLFAEVEGADR